MTKKNAEQTGNDERRDRIIDHVERHIETRGVFPSVRDVTRAIGGNTAMVSEVLRKLRTEREDRARFEQERTLPDWVLQSAKDIYRRAEREFASRLDTMRLGYEAQTRRLEEDLRRKDMQIEARDEQLAEGRNREQKVMAERDRAIAERDEARQDCALLRKDNARRDTEHAKSTRDLDDSDRQARRAKRPMAPKLRKARMARRKSHA